MLNQISILKYTVINISVTRSEDILLGNYLQTDINKNVLPSYNACTMSKYRNGKKSPRDRIVKVIG